MSEQRFFPISEVYEYFGYRSGAAMLKAFERGQLPQGCLVRIAVRVVRVDKVELEKWFLERGIRSAQERRLPGF